MTVMGIMIKKSGRIGLAERPDLFFKTIQLFFNRLAPLNHNYFLLNTEIPPTAATAARA